MIWNHYYLGGVEYSVNAYTSEFVNSNRSGNIVGQDEINLCVYKLSWRDLFLTSMHSENFLCECQKLLSFNNK